MPIFGNNRDAGGQPKIPVDAILALEHSFFKVPFEQARRIFRISQRLLDRELASLRQSAVDGGAADPAKAAARIRQLLEKLDGQEKEGRAFIDRTIRRMRLVQEAVSSDSVESQPFLNWKLRRLDRLVGEYILRQGMLASASLLAEADSLQDYMDLELFSQINSIERALDAHNAAECLVWCAENRFHLKRTKSDLEFALRKQEFVELARRRELGPAIAYAKKHFGQWWETHAREIEQATALLAIGPDTLTEPYLGLYGVDRWADLKNQFRANVYQLYSLPPIPQLVSTMQAGLSALKTPMCYEQYDKNINCPVCTFPLSLLAASLPYSHHEHSCIVCRVTGDVMDEDNPPMIAPNGHVYSKRALVQMSSAGTVVCPRSGDSFKTGEFKKLFIC